jgi:hypothetical protein
VRRRVLAVALAAAAAAGGCGGGDEADERLEAYVGEANAIQRDAEPRTREIAKAYEEYSSGKLQGREAVQRLIVAEAAIEQTRTELAALRPPAEARRLHDLLLRLYAANVAFAGETTQLAAYVPAARAELARLDLIRRELSTSLRAAGKPAEQASALRRYASALRRRVARLRDLAPPPVLAPSARRQLRRLDGARRLAGRLADALAASDAERVARLLQRFRATGGGDPEVDKLARAAFEGYRVRRKQIDELATQVLQERARTE